MEVDLSNIQFSNNDIKRGIKIPNKITQDVAYLCGVLAGDGHISKEDVKSIKYRVICGGNPKDEKEFYDIMIKNLLNKLFNIDVKPHNSCDGTYRVMFESKAIVAFLTKIIGLPRGKKYDSLKIPNLFLENKNLLLCFVRGLFDTDFGFCLSKRYQSKPYYPQICFDSKSKSFAIEIWNALKFLNIKFKGKVYQVYDKDERTKAGYTITYKFDLYGHKYFVSILKVIGLRHPKHLAKYNQWLKVNENNLKVKKLIAEDSGGWI